MQYPAAVLKVFTGSGEVKLDALDFSAFFVCGGCGGEYNDEKRVMNRKQVSVNFGMRMEKGEFGKNR